MQKILCRWHVETHTRTKARNEIYAFPFGRYIVWCLCNSTHHFHLATTHVHYDSIL